MSRKIGNLKTHGGALPAALHDRRAAIPDSLFERLRRSDILPYVGTASSFAFVLAVVLGLL
jgi:hypothetical protein